MEGSVLSFLKVEWKVNDTDSAHWASSSVRSGIKRVWKHQRGNPHIEEEQTTQKKMTNNDIQSIIQKT